MELIHWHELGKEIAAFLTEHRGKNAGFRVAYDDMLTLAKMMKRGMDNLPQEDVDKAAHANINEAQQVAQQVSTPETEVLKGRCVLYVTTVATALKKRPDAEGGIDMALIWSLVTSVAVIEIAEKEGVI